MSPQTKYSWIAALLFSSLILSAGAQQTAMLVDAPFPHVHAVDARPGKIDLALWSADATVRALDVHSTQRFLRHGYVEEIAPRAMTNTPAMVAWESAITIGFICSDRWAIRHRRRRLVFVIRAAMVADVVVIAQTDVHNYRLVRK